MMHCWNILSKEQKWEAYINKKSDEASDATDDAERPIGQKTSEALTASKKRNQSHDDDDEKEIERARKSEMNAKRMAANEKNNANSDALIEIQRKFYIKDLIPSTHQR